MDTSKYEQQGKINLEKSYSRITSSVDTFDQFLNSAPGNIALKAASARTKIFYSTLSSHYYEIRDKEKLRQLRGLIEIVEAILEGIAGAMIHSYRYSTWSEESETEAGRLLDKSLQMGDEYISRWKSLVTEYRPEVP